MANKALFFDRDGTLNVDTDYLHKPEEFVWLPGAPEAIRLANQRGYLVIVITNQSGVARGYFGEEDVRRLHQWMNQDLKRFGAHIDDFYYCPHLPGGPIPAYAVECECRKPKPGLIEAACRDHHIDREASLLIGDAPRDVECAVRAGVRGIRYEGGNLLTLVERALSSDAADGTSPGPAAD